jgi:hypothetical protein
MSFFRSSVHALVVGAIGLRTETHILHMHTTRYLGVIKSEQSMVEVMFSGENFSPCHAKLPALFV